MSAGFGLWGGIAGIAEELRRPWWIADRQGIYTSGLAPDVGPQRCGIFERQSAPFCLKGSVGTASGFAQLNRIYDAFFGPRAIAEDITQAGMTGVSFWPTVYHRTGEECADRLQLVISTVIACVETSRLPTVTCRADNEEVIALRATIDAFGFLSHTRFGAIR